MYGKTGFEIIGSPPTTEHYITQKNVNKDRFRNCTIRASWTYTMSFDIFQESSEANVFAPGDTCGYCIHL